MCMEDIRTGRVQTAKESVVTVTDTESQVLSLTNHRASLHIMNIGANAVTLQRRPGVTAGLGMVLAAGASLPLYDIIHHGGMVTSNMFGRCAAGLTTTLAITESLLYEE